MPGYDRDAPGSELERARRYLAHPNPSMHRVVQNELLRTLAGATGPGARSPLAAIVEQLPVGIIIVDAASGRVVAQNERAAALFGSQLLTDGSLSDYTQRYVATRPDGSRYRADELPVARAIRHGETVIDEEIEVRLPEGGSLVLLVCASPVRGPNGNVRWAVATLADVTDRRSEALRRDFFARLAAAFQARPQPHEILRTATAALGEQLGVSSAALGEADAALRVLSVHAEYRNGVHHGFSRHDLEELGVPLRAELGSGGVIAIEDVARHPLIGDDALDALTALGARSLLLVRVPRESAQAGIILITHAAPRRWSRDDIGVAGQLGERTWAAHDAAVRDSSRRMNEQWLRYALRAGAAAAWEWDLGTDRLCWSEEHHALLGVDRNKPIQTVGAFMQLVHEADRARARRGIARIGRIDAPREVGMECRVIRPDGETRWIRLQGRVLLDEHGRPGRAYGVLLDITQRKHAELEREALLRKLRAADEAKSNFISVMSHEFRTPLTSVIGYSELLSSGATGELNAAQLQQLSRIKASAWHLTQVIDEVLTFSRIEAGHERVQIAGVDGLQVAREALAIVEPAARAKGLALETAMPDHLVVESDGGKLRQVLVNLLGNAVKFTESGSVRFVIAAEPDAVSFEVRDTGIGIAAEYHEKIFDRFWQADRGSARAHGGTGLGLTVSKRLTELLGGTISVESEVGQGSVFRVRLPVRCTATPRS